MSTTVSKQTVESMENLMKEAMSILKILLIAPATAWPLH